MFERRDFLLAPRGTHCHRAMEEVLQHRTPAQCLGLSPTRTCKLDRSRMSFHPNTPAQFSAGVGQEPQTPALAPRPHPAQILRYTLYRIGTKYRSGHSNSKHRTPTQEIPHRDTRIAVPEHKKQSTATQGLPHRNATPSPAK